MKTPIYEKIKKILEDDPSSRDSDERVVWYYFKRNYLNGGDMSNLTFEEALEAMHNGRVPTIESITRARRKVQEEFPHLRGAGYAGRKKQAEIKRAHFASMKQKGFL